MQKSKGDKRQSSTRKQGKVATKTARQSTNKRRKYKSKAKFKSKNAKPKHTMRELEIGRM